MTDDFVAERYLGLWKEEGRSDWSAVLRQTGYKRYGVTLEKSSLNSDDRLSWRPQWILSWDVHTPELALEEAAKAISEMTTHLLVIGAGLRRDLDEPVPAEGET